jgi:ligand-binding SRPBCC domain-containing protein
MIQAHRKIHIDAPVEKVFAFAIEPENLLEIWPSLMKVHNIERSPTAGNSWDWEYKMAGITLRGHNETTEFVPNKRVVAENKEGIKSKFYWLYSAENGGTSLDLTVEYDMPIPVLGKLAEKVVVKMNENEMDTLMSNLKAIMEA